MISPREYLEEQVDDLLEGRIDLPEFEKRFYFYYVEQVPDDALSEREFDFYGLAQEQLDWTAEVPGEDRRYGYIDHEEYVHWLRWLRARFTAGEEIGSVLCAGDGRYQPPCANCGEPAGPRFCPHCGQELSPRDRPLLGVVREVAADWWSLDSRLLRSLGALARPGRLSELYVSGKRAPFLRPFRLYLLASLALFSTLLTLDPPQADRYDLYIGDELLVEAQQPVDGAGAGSSGGGTVRQSLQLVSTSSLVARLSGGSMDERIERMRRRPPQEVIDTLFASLRRVLPLTLIVFVPFLALILKLLYIRGRAARTLYLDHLVFALHFQSALFVALTVSWLVSRLFGIDLGVGALLLYALISLLMLTAYLGLALRRFYAQSRRWTALKALILIWLYMKLLELAVSLSLLGGIRSF